MGVCQCGHSEGEHHFRSNENDYPCLAKGCTCRDFTPKGQKDDKMDEKKKWKMPDWLRQYEPFIVNTGGNKIEDLMNGHTNLYVNGPRALLEMSVEAQIALLKKLRAAGRLKKVDASDQPTDCGECSKNDDCPVGHDIEGCVGDGDGK